MIHVLSQLTRNKFAFIRFSSTLAVKTIPQVIGSGPQYNKHLILQVPLKASLWPSRLESISELFTTIGKSQRFQEGKVGYTFSESPIVKDPSNSQEKGLEISEESYQGTLYPDHIPVRLSLSTLDAFEQKYLSTTSTSPPISTDSIESITLSSNTIYVCTHNSRDCRCGEVGEPLYQALLKETKKRMIDEKDLKIERIAHVGGHIYAANILMYRNGISHDWYGLLKASDAKEIIDHAISTSAEPFNFEFWRGRLGLTSEQLKEKYIASLPASKAASLKKSLERKPLGEKVILMFEDVEGIETEVVAFEGESLMESAKRADLEAILATCGGAGECSTCHCHIDPLEDGTFPGLPELSDTEDEQLDFALGRDENSRLSCQIQVTKQLGDWIVKGGRIRLPEY